MCVLFFTPLVYTLLDGDNSRNCDRNITVHLNDGMLCSLCWVRFLVGRGEQWQKGEEMASEPGRAK